jgi:hypothetical protein
MSGQSLPWIKGQPLGWDVTVVDTLAGSYYGGQKILAVNFCHFKKKAMLYFIVIMITVLIMIGIFGW